MSFHVQIGVVSLASRQPMIPLKPGFNYRDLWRCRQQRELFSLSRSPAPLEPGADQHQVGRAGRQQRDCERGMHCLSGCSKGRLHDGENIRRF